MEDTNINQILIDKSIIDINDNVSEVDVNRQKLTFQLIEMGYKLEQIDKCFLFFECNSLGQISTYLTKEDGIWQHKFIEGENKRDCEVCNEYASHLDLKITTDIKLNSNSFNSSYSFSEISLKNSFLSQQIGKIEITERNCLVCFNTLEKESRAYKMKCRHYFCLDCWYLYLEEKITNFKVDKIKCMMHDCKFILEEEQILKLIDKNPQLIDKYHRFKLRKEILISNNKKFCPVIDCTGYGEFVNNPFITCIYGHDFCYNCLHVGWHSKRKCEDVMEADFEKWKKGKIIKKCPRCKYRTEKNLGCNHMKCACNYEWCWICEGEYKSDHYMRGQACWGLQFSKLSF